MKYFLNLLQLNRFYNCINTNRNKMQFPIQLSFETPLNIRYNNKTFANLCYKCNWKWIYHRYAHKYIRTYSCASPSVILSPLYILTQTPRRRKLYYYCTLSFLFVILKLCTLFRYVCVYVSLSSAVIETILHCSFNTGNIHTYI